MHAVIVLVIIQLLDHKSFDCAGLIPTKDSLNTFLLWPIITYEYYSLFLYLYGSEVGNKDF